MKLLTEEGRYPNLIALIITLIIALISGLLDGSFLAFGAVGVGVLTGATMNGIVVIVFVLFCAFVIIRIVFDIRGSVLITGVGRIMWLARTLNTGTGRLISWASLIIPAKRREEMEGDFLESIETARVRGFGPFGIFMLRIAKGLLYVWIGLKLRVTDFVSLEIGKKETRYYSEHSIVDYRCPCGILHE